MIDRYYYFLIFLNNKYNAIIKKIIIIKIILRVVLTFANSIKKFEKVAISKVPITAPIDIEINVFQGFIPIRRPTIEPTNPPEP